ncbi:MAG: peptidylprolyl isomerase [Nitrospinaceae bacterium]
MLKNFKFETAVILCFWLLSLAAVCPAAQEKPAGSAAEVALPDVVARVNGVPVDANIIQFQLKRLMKKINQPLNSSQKRKIILDMIEKEVIRELVYQQGKEEHIPLDPKLVEKQLEAIRKPYKNEEEFKKALMERNLTEDHLRQSIKVDIVAHKLLEKQIQGKINISPEEVKKYYETNQKKFVRPEAYRARHIFISIYPPELIQKSTPKELEARTDELRKKAEEKIRQILKEVRAGADFKDLAKKYSHDTGSAKKGGDLDFIYKGVFDPAFDLAVSKLKPGEVSGVVQTPFGFHIIKLIETKPSELAPFSEMEKGIQKHLFTERAKKKVQDYIAKLRKNAKIEILF